MDRKLISFLKELKAYGQEHDIPNVTERVGLFLNLMVKVSGSKQVLEIGTANGYSTIWMAEAVQKNGGRITTIDFSEPTFRQAEVNFKKTAFDRIIDMYLGNVLKILPSIAETECFDFVFVDGQKASYLDFWNLIKTRLSPGAVVVFDDVLAFPDKTKPFMEHMKSEELDQVILPIDDKDGILLVRIKD